MTADKSVGDGDVSGGGWEKAHDEFEDGGFATTGWADEDPTTVGGDGPIESGEDPGGLGGEPEAGVVELDGRVIDGEGVDNTRGWGG